MKAISLPAFGGCELFHIKQMPDLSPKEYEVKVRLKAIGFNPVDYKMRQGEFPSDLPLILGADGAGVVESVGSKVKDLVAGDEVIVFVFGQGSNGTYAEAVCIDRLFVCKKPSSLSFEEAAALPLVGLTVLRAFKAMNVKSGDHSLFIVGGGGGVGSTAISLAKCFPGINIFTTASGQESAEYLQEILGVKPQNILFYKGLSVEDQIKKSLALHQGKPFDYALDCVGKEAKRLCLSLLRFKGHFASIVPEGGDFSLELFARGIMPTFARSLSVHFIFVGSESFGGAREDWKEYQTDLLYLVSLIEKGQLKLPAPTVLGSFSVETVQQAHRLLESGKVKGKLVMSVS